MDFDLSQVAQTLAIYALPVLFAITLHEAAHGYVARHFGDMTAHAQGRISLNPVRHIDIIGTIVVPLVILLLSYGKFLFGWARPVPVNYSALRKPRQHMAWVAAAGPGANLAMALAWALVLRASVSMTSRADAWMQVAQQYGVSGLIDVVMRHGNGAAEFLVGVSAAGVLVNLLLMLLNLLPILPLDGGRIVASLLPTRAAWRFAKLEPFGVPLLLLLLFVPVYGSSALSWILSPLLFESEALLRAMVLL
ncbi:MAG TPA: site-2 protease family protein, partial [Burkholderiales bacterium]|jgi:Zn-dependent protease|nr:site-2 protease family protein [Burkholderiales bacterium]